MVEIIGGLWLSTTVGPPKVLQEARYWFSLILEFLSGLFLIPMLSVVCFVKKELDDPFKFQKACPDFSI